MKHCKLLAIAILLITLLSVLPITVFAADETYYCNICKENHKGEFKNIAEIAYKINDVVYGGNIFDNTTNEILKLNLTNVLGGKGEGQTFNTGIKTAFQNLWTALKEPYKLFAVIGKLLMVVFVMVQSLQQTSIRSISGEDLFKLFAKVAIGSFIIDNGYDILSIIIELGSNMFDNIYTGKITISGGDKSKCIFEKALEYDFKKSALSILNNILPWLIMQVAKVVVFISAWSRVLEIAVRTMFAPLGMADMITEGIRGNGMRYLRKFLSCAIQGAVILASVKVYSLACNTMTSGGVIMQSALACVLIVVMFRSKEFSEQITGIV